MFRFKLCLTQRAQATAVTFTTEFSSNVATATLLNPVMGALAVCIGQVSAARQLDAIIAKQKRQPITYIIPILYCAFATC